MTGLLKRDVSDKSIKNLNYISIIMPDGSFSYGGNQGWFSEGNWLNTDSKISKYGCGTIAASDLFLYWAMQNSYYNNEETQLAIKNGRINQEDYLNYVRRINREYTKTPRWLGVLGPKLASAINSYNKKHNINYRASWEWKLSYDEMLDKIYKMLGNDIPVIFSVGPNTPNLWGKKEVNMYVKLNKGDAGYNDDLNEMRQYTKKRTVNGHYMTITGITCDNLAGRIMLCISSWGKKYYIDYDEYRDYIDKYGGTYTSSLIYIK